MNKIFVLLMLCLPTLAHADFIASAGLQGGNLESENISNSDPVLKSSVYGIKGEIEFGFPYLTFFGAFDVSRGAGRSQYDFTNPDNASDTAQVNDLKTTVTLSKISGGVRLKLIKLQNFRLYVAGGANTGFMGLTYDKDHFKSKTGSTTGYEEYERQTIHGGFGEVGMEFIFTQNSGLRLSAQRVSFRTDQFETLNREKLKFNYTVIALNFIEYIETGSW